MSKLRVRLNKVFFPKEGQKTHGEFTIALFKISEIVTPVQGFKCGDIIKLKGSMPILNFKTDYTVVVGKEEANPKFGSTYWVDNIFTKASFDTPEDVKLFLETLTSKKLAEAMLDKFPNVIEILKDKDIETLCEVKGIGSSLANKIIKGFEATEDNSAALIVGRKCGLSDTLIRKIVTHYKSVDMAIDMIENNPYQLSIDVTGIGFKKADEIACKVGKVTYDTRCKACIYHILLQEAESGRSYLQFPQLYGEIEKAITLNGDPMIALNLLVHEGIVIISSNGQSVALKKYYDLEMEIAKEFLRLSSAENKFSVENWMDIVRELEEEQGWFYTGEQLTGIETVLNNNVTVITGLAGTGKSTITNATSKILKDFEIAQVALAGKAAQRLQEVTGLPSSTIHRLIGRNNSKENQSYLNIEILVVDESSMINGDLFLSLLKKISSGTKIILLGDQGQLSAIGNCNVLADLVSSNVIKHINLTKVHRQAQMSAIISKSIEIRQQRHIVDKDFKGTMIMGELQDLKLCIQEEGLQEIVLKCFADDLSKVNNNVLEVQVIAPLKTRGLLSTYELNLLLQDYYNGINKIGVHKVINLSKDKAINIYVGDKVINTKNNYTTKDIDGESCPIFNGNIGIVKKIEEEKVVVHFSGVGTVVLETEEIKFLNLAYAISVHSSQGSQWKRVIIAMDMSSFIMLNAELVYTAITRAEKHATLISSNKALRKATNTLSQTAKQTLTANFLRYLNNI